MSWPIESLTSHRFRGIEDLTLGGTGRINLLVGDNNSGKTSILEAMSVYCKPLDTFAWIDTARRRVRGFRGLSIVDAMKWLFPHGKQASGEGEELFSGDIAVSGRGQAGARTARARFEEFEEIGIIDQPGEAGPSEERLERGATLSSTATTVEGVDTRSVQLEEGMIRRTRSERENRSLSRSFLPSIMASKSCIRDSFGGRWTEVTRARSSRPSGGLILALKTWISCRRPSLIVPSVCRLPRSTCATPGAVERP